MNLKGYPFSQLNEASKWLLILFFMAGLFTAPAISQISYLGKTFHFQDGFYGLRGTRSMCFSQDKKNIYVCSQIALAVFSFDTITGEVIFLEAYKNYTDGITGLESSGRVVVSPDDKFVYVSSQTEHCVALFRRDKDTGLLDFVTAFNEGENGNIGLRGVDGMGITANGEYMYFAAGNSPKISAFRRDTLSGHISHLQSIGEYDEGGMPRPFSLVLSNDNRFLYVLSIFVDVVNVFEIDPSTGLIQFVQQTEPISGLWFTAALEISYDDNFLYVASQEAMVVFARNIQSGILTFVKIFDADDNDISGLHGLYSLSVSPDDQNIYALSAQDTSFVTFSRNLNTDEFQFVQSQPFMHPWESNPQHSSSAMLADNQYVFGNSYWESGIHMANRNSSSGILSYNQLLYDGQDAIIDGLYNPVHCCSDYEQKHVFVTTRYEGISVFSRNDTSGLLTYKSVINNDSLGTSSLNVAYKSMVSLDDKYFYTIAGFASNAVILIFEIDHANHQLKILDSITAGQNGIEELRFARDLAMSSDMKHVYVAASHNTNDVLQFGYNPENGTLDYIKSYDFDNTSSNFKQIKITNNGEYIFLASNSSNTLMMLKRNIETGELSYLLKYRNTLPGGVPVYGLKTMDVSQDNKNLYVAYNVNTMLVNFSINAENDTLHVLQIMAYDSSSNNGIQKVDNIHVRHDGTFVFTSSRDNHSLGFFYRDQRAGMLTFIHDFTEPEWDFDGLDGISWIEITQNDRSLYLTSDYEEGIASYKIDLYLGPDLAICQGDTVLLDAGQGYLSYEWSNNNTTRQIKAWEEGWYSVETSDYFGFTDTDSLYLTVNYLPELDLGADIHACYGDTAILWAGVHDKVLWSTGSAAESIIVTSNGEYSVLVTNENNCSKSDTIIATFDTVQVELGPDTTITASQSITISPNHIPGNTYLWYNGSTDSSIVISRDNFSTHSLNVWVNVNNIYGCEGSDSIMVYIIPDPEPPSPRIDVMPVPTRESITVKSNYIIVEIICYDIYGNHIFTQKFNSEICNINLEPYARGTYFLNIKLNTGFEQLHRVIRL